MKYLKNFIGQAFNPGRIGFAFHRAGWLKISPCTIFRSYRAGRASKDERE